MAKKLSQKTAEAFMQYSKKMCTRVSVFWMVYRIAALAIVFFRPNIADAIIRITEGVDTAMILNMGFYTANSGTEKVAIAFGKNHSGTAKNEDDEESEENEKDEEGKDNG